jgi:hypothetical protein
MTVVSRYAAEIRYPDGGRLTTAERTAAGREFLFAAAENLVITPWPGNIECLASPAPPILHTPGSGLTGNSCLRP